VQAHEHLALEIGRAYILIAQLREEIDRLKPFEPKPATRDGQQVGALEARGRE
jgi:hypothetical protein